GGCIFDVKMFVLAGSAFCREDAAAVGILEVAIRELIMPFGILSILVIYCQIPLTVFREPVPLNKFILLLGGRLVFTPRVQLVVDELALVDQFLGMLVRAVAQSDGHGFLTSLLVSDRAGTRLAR